MAAGKVEIGAFRTYPPNYKPPDAVASEYQSIPLDKIEVLKIIFVEEVSVVVGVEEDISVWMNAILLSVAIMYYRLPSVTIR